MVTRNNLQLIPQEYFKIDATTAKYDDVNEAVIHYRSIYLQCVIIVSGVSAYNQQIASVRKDNIFFEQVSARCRTNGGIESNMTWNVFNIGTNALKRSQTKNIMR